MSRVEVRTRSGTKEATGPNRRRPYLAGSSVAVLALFLAALWAPSAQATPPQVISTSFANVTTTSVKLQAAVNPQGSSTQVHFEYGAANCESSACAKTVNVNVGAGASEKKAEVTIEGLLPAASYHFRVVAKSVEGTASGTDTIFTTFAPPPSFGACPNDAFRISPPQPSAALPDCRAYEQASPAQKNALDARGRVAFVKASPAGDRISFMTAGGAPGSEGAQELPVYLASRGGSNWSTQGVLPPESYGQETFVVGWLADFSQVFDSARRANGAGGGTLLARSSEDGSIAEVIPYGTGLKTDPPSYVGASADGSEVIFESKDKLSGVNGAIEGKTNLYLWNREANTVTLAGVLNDETAPPAGAFAGPYDWIGAGPGAVTGGIPTAHYYTQEQRAISPDGTKIYFTAGQTGKLYVRENPTAPQSPISAGKCIEPATKACTVQVSATEKTNGNGLGGSDPAGSRPAAFMEASLDGNVALFTSSEKLTNDANTGPEVLPASIARANLADGSGAEISFLPTKAKGLAVSGNYIYWTDPIAGAIGRAKLNGAGAPSEIQGEFIIGAGTPQYVAVDGSHVYWTDAGNGEKEGGRIGRADLEGKNSEPSFIAGATNPQGIDAEGEFLYWSNAGEEDATRTIGRAKLGVGGAEGVEQEFIGVGGGVSEETPQGLAVDTAHIYVGIINVRQKQNFIVRFDLNGSNEKFIFDGKETEVKGLSVDAGHVYWARQGASAIGRAKLDLSELNLEFIKAAQGPLGMAVDGEHIYWSAGQESPPNPGNDLYRWDANASGKKLSDLTVNNKDAAGAQVLGVLGSSADTSLIYLAANGDLDGAGPGKAGDCKGSAPGSGLSFSGRCNLYLVRSAAPGTAEFIAPLNADGPGKSDAFNWLPHGGVNQSQKTARVSTDGQTLLFRSQNKLSAYENKGTPELYRYRIGEGIDCVSCDPSGAAPTGTPSLASIGLSSPYITGEFNYTLTRNLSAEGNQVFFETTDALVGTDTNGLGGCPEVGFASGTPFRTCLDAYEWEAQGTGSCQAPNADGGCVYLLSSGKSTDASYFADASAGGEDAFVVTRSPLVPQDQDQLYDVYDARVGGGLAGQNAVPSVPCENEGCRGPVKQPPTFASPGTASFSGPPNPKPKKAKKKARHHKGKGKGKGKGKSTHKKHRAKSQGKVGR